MPAKSSKSLKAAREQEESVSLDDLTEEQLADIVAHSVTVLAEDLVSKGIDDSIVTLAFFRVFAERMANINDRHSYDSILEEALETPWEDVSLH